MDYLGKKASKLNVAVLYPHQPHLPHHTSHICCPPNSSVAVIAGTQVPKR